MEIEEEVPSLALARARVLGRRCLKIIESIPNFNTRQIYSLDNFEFRVNEFSVEFWPKKKKERKSILLTSDRSHREIKGLIFKEGRGQLFLDDSAGLAIKKNIGDLGDEKYPHFEFRWTGFKYAKHKVGDLVFAKVVLENQDYVNYENDDNEVLVGKHNGKNKEELPEDLPQSLAREKQLLGIEVERYIDFGRMADEIVDYSGIDRFFIEVNARFG